MRRIMLHTVLMSRSKFTRYTGFFEIFGVDILLDSDLRAWFIEAVDNPGIHADTAVKKHLFESMIKSTIEMQNALIYEDQALFDDIIDTSMFQRVFDERKQGTERYANLLSEDCIIQNSPGIQ